MIKIYPQPTTSVVTSSITTIAAVTQLSFTGSVTGAIVGDSVVVTPVTATVTVGCSYYAKVTSANTVTIYINNSSAASNTLTAGTWTVTVLQRTSI